MRTSKSPPQLRVPGPDWARLLAADNVLRLCSLLVDARRTIARGGQFVIGPRKAEATADVYCTLEQLEELVAHLNAERERAGRERLLIATR